jgi:3-phosphoshikimate 1-carboxyvinyltransferase
MTTLTLKPTTLSGRIIAPSSKSMGHRALICAALAEGESRIENISVSKDILATRQCLEALGTTIRESEKLDGRSVFSVLGRNSGSYAPLMACGESGSTLRFMIPLAALDQRIHTFIGEGELGNRPLTPYEQLFREQGLRFEYGSAHHFPLTVQGPLHSGNIVMPGNVSSQFISGLLLALPLVHGDSCLTVTEPFESQSYVDLTLSALQSFGITIEHTEKCIYHIPGNQHYKPHSGPVEGDFSQAAFWLVAGLLGQEITVTGIRLDSLQGDRAIISILKNMGGCLKKSEDGMISSPATFHGTVIDASNCPDLVPVLSVAAALAQGHTEIIHAERLRLKECDRLAAMARELNKIGAHIVERPDGLSIDGVKNFNGGTVDSWNDHRVAMSLAIASIRCKEPLRLNGAECVAKSYPAFWQDFAALGGQYE